MDICTTCIGMKQLLWESDPLHHIFEQHYREEQHVPVDHAFGRFQLFTRGPATHSDTKARLVEVPGILPRLRLCEKAVRVLTPLSMDHEEVFIVGTMSILHKTVQVLGSGRDGIEHGPEGFELPVPVGKLFFTSRAKLVAVVTADPDRRTHVMGTQPRECQDDEEQNAAESSYEYAVKRVLVATSIRCHSKRGSPFWYMWSYTPAGRACWSRRCLVSSWYSAKGASDS